MKEINKVFISHEFGGQGGMLSKIQLSDLRINSNKNKVFAEGAGKVINFPFSYQYYYRTFLKHF